MSRAIQTSKLNPVLYAVRPAVREFVTGVPFLLTPLTGPAWHAILPATMGVSIHYRGRLNDVGQLARLCEELTDIATVMGWESTRLDDDWGQPGDARLRVTPTGARIDGHLGLKGVQITPEADAESLSFFFDREGNLRPLMDVVSILDGTLDPREAWVSVKTQFASPAIHVWIVGLLKYLKKRYLSDLQVSDEGEYWESGDIRVLKEKMDLIGAKLNQISDALSSCRLGDVSGLSPEQIASRIEQLLLDRFKIDDLDSTT
jgi:hypothetical protein